MRIRSITIDCHDPYRQARFWSAATGWLEDPEDPNNPATRKVGSSSARRASACCLSPCPRANR